MFAKMVSMAHTPDDIKKEAAEYAAAPVSSGAASGPRYPYGLCISLGEDELEKLGLDGDLPKIGEVMQFTALARVTSASMSERETAGGEPENCCRVELQITDMGVPAANEVDRAVEKSEQRRARFYGSSHAEPDGDEG